MAHNGHAVIDFKTTGLSPQYRHRVIEIGIVHVAPDGTIEDSFETVVNPGRGLGLGPTHINQLHGADVKDAHTLTDVADHFVEQVRERVLVAHNARLETTFLPSLTREPPRTSSAPISSSAATRRSGGASGATSLSALQVRKTKEALVAAGIPVIALDRYDGRSVDADKVGTVKRTKGVEFMQVLLARVEPALLASGPEPTSETDRERRDLDRRELHVAMTRARDRLWVGVRSLRFQPAGPTAALGNDGANATMTPTPRGKIRGHVSRRALARLCTPHQEAHMPLTNHELVGRAVM